MQITRMISLKHRLRIVILFWKRAWNYTFPAKLPGDVMLQYVTPFLWSSSCWVAVASVYLSLPNGLPRFSSGLFKTKNLIHTKHYVNERVDIQLKICKQKCIPSDSLALSSICSLTLPLTLLHTPKANGGRKVGRIQLIIIFLLLF